MIPESISGSGKGVYESRLQTQNVTGSFSDAGLIVVKGSVLNNVNEYMYNHATVTLKDFAYGKVTELYRKLHWTDILALVELQKTFGQNPYTKLPGYHAGNNNYVYFDELAVMLIVQEIAASDGKQDWNSIIQRKYPKPPDLESQDNSPFNPKSPYYDLSKSVFYYDPDNGIIIYKSGEIVWTETKRRYYEAANGLAYNYDKAKQTVLFMNGAVLNLKTLELVTPGKETVIVKNTIPWYQQILNNTGLLLSILAGLVLLIIIKKRNE